MLGLSAFMICIINFSHLLIRESKPWTCAQRRTSLWMIVQKYIASPSSHMIDIKYMVSLSELGTFIRMPTMFRSHVNRPPYPSSRSSSSSRSSNFIMKIVSSNSIKNRSGSFNNSFMSSLDNVTMYSFSDSQINL